MLRTAVAMLTIVAGSAAYAADTPPREIDFTQTLQGPTGENLTNCTKFEDDDSKKKCLQTEKVTLGDIASVALETMMVKDQSIDPKVKFDRDILARKIYKNAHATLSVDEIKTIKDRIGEVYGPGQIGATWPLLDPTLTAPK